MHGYVTELFVSFFFLTLYKNIFCFVITVIISYMNAYKSPDFLTVYHICIHTRLCIAELNSSSSCLPFCQTENMLIIKKKKALLLIIVFLKVVFSLEAIREPIRSPFSKFVPGLLKMVPHVCRIFTVRACSEEAI